MDDSDKQLQDFADWPSWPGDLSHPLTVLRDSLRLNQLNVGYTHDGTKPNVIYRRRVRQLKAAIELLENQ